MESRSWGSLTRRAGSMGQPVTRQIVGCPGLPVLHSAEQRLSGEMCPQLRLSILTLTLFCSCQPESLPCASKTVISGSARPSADNPMGGVAATKPLAILVPALFCSCHQESLRRAGCHGRARAVFPVVACSCERGRIDQARLLRMPAFCARSPALSSFTGASYAREEHWQASATPRCYCQILFICQASKERSFASWPWARSETPTLSSRPG